MSRMSPVALSSLWCVPALLPRTFPSACSMSLRFCSRCSVGTGSSTSRDLLQVRRPLEPSFVEGSCHGGLVERHDVDHVGQVSREPHRPEHVL